jgi:uncharacterized protein (TIGR02444 family)
MPLWDWAVAAYARPGVEPACLTLQDDHGQNVSFLLWAAWARTADPARLAQAADIARRWEVLTLGPIRLVRRALKLGFPGVPDLAREALREDVKAAELRAERVLLEALEALTPGPGAAPALQALQAATVAWGNAAPAKALAALAAALV